MVDKDDHLVLDVVELFKSKGWNLLELEELVGKDTNHSPPESE